MTVGKISPIKYICKQMSTFYKKKKISPRPNLKKIKIIEIFVISHGSRI